VLLEKCTYYFFFNAVKFTCLSQVISSPSIFFSFAQWRYSNQ
jgi:hypothetical protein